MRPRITGRSREFREVTRDTSAARCTNFDRVSRLLRFARVRRNGRGVLHRCLMRCLCILRRLDNIKIVLVLSTCICVFGRVQDLLLSLKLLLKHDLSLLLIIRRASVLQRLRVTSCTAITLEVLRGSCSASVIL